MKSIKLSQAFLFVFFLCAALLSNTFAQCEGVYFKTAQRSIFTSPSAFYVEYQLEPDKNKDINGDGKTDLVGTLTQNNTKKVFISYNDGSGNFGSPVELLLPTPINLGTDYFIEDYDNDGLKDFFVYYYSNAQNGRAIVVYRNGGNGTFTPLAPTNLQAEGVENIADINNDNRADLLLITIDSLQNRLYRLANSDGTFAAPVMSPAANLTYKFAGDFNGDGKVDFAQNNLSEPNRPLRIYFNQGNGNFALSGALSNLGANRILGVTDFNNDGRPDLLVTSSYMVGVLINLGNQTFSSADYAIYNGSNPFEGSYFVTDLNGDNFQDLLLQVQHTSPFNPPPPQKYITFINNGSGVFTKRFYTNPFRGTPAGDLDGDNKADLIVIENYFPPEYGTSQRIFNETKLSITKNVCQNPGQTKTIDFDGDGIPNLVFHRPDDGRWRFSGPLVNSTQVTFNWGQSGDVPQPGDYDGDGKTDAAVFRPGNGVWYIINSSNSSFTFFQFGADGDKPVSSDYDGDGKTDLAVFRPSTGDWYILQSGTGQFYGAHWGAATDKPVPEDYDGDGKTDLAVYRPSQGNWYYLKSSDGSFTALNWGANGDVPVPADYDGDGKADVTVFRPADNDWYILRSFNYQFVAVRFGLAGDILQYRDSGGAGVAEIGVYRPSNGVWYFSNSGSFSSFFPSETGEIPLSLKSNP